MYMFCSFDFDKILYHIHIIIYQIKNYILSMKEILNS